MYVAAKIIIIPDELNIQKFSSKNVKNIFCLILITCSLSKMLLTLHRSQKELSEIFKVCCSSSKISAQTAYSYHIMCEDIQMLD